MSDDYRGHEEEGDPWAEFQAAQGDVPVERTAEERQADLNIVKGDAEDIYEAETQAFLFLLAAAVAKLGGSVTFTKEEREVRYALGIDQSDLGDGTGPLRLFAVLQEAE